MRMHAAPGPVIIIIWSGLIARIYLAKEKRFHGMTFPVILCAGKVATNAFMQPGAWREHGKVQPVASPLSGIVDDAICMYHPAYTYHLEREGDLDPLPYVMADMGDAITAFVHQCDPDIPTPGVGVVAQVIMDTIEECADKKWRVRPFQLCKRS